MVPQFLYVLIIVKDMNMRIKFLGSLGFSVMIGFKYAMIIARHRKVAEYLHMIAYDWNDTDNDYHKDVMMKKAKTGKTLTIISMVLLYSGLMPFTVIPSTRRPIVIGNVTYWRLPYPAYFHFFDPRIKPIYNFVYLIQGLSASMRYVITCGIYSIVIMSVMHICSRVTIMSAMLQQLAVTYNRKLLGRIVQQHINFLILAYKLENIFKEIVAVEVLGSILNICFLGFYFITGLSGTESIVMVVVLMLLWSSFVFNIFILCYIGEKLTEQCESVRFAAYKINWYQLPCRDIRDAVLLISLKRKPVVLTAGKIMTLSLETFTSILKLAASYLNILRTMTANAS